jgi:hypothetical protein
MVSAVDVLDAHGVHLQTLIITGTCQLQVDLASFVSSIDFAAR